MIKKLLLVVGLAAAVGSLAPKAHAQYVNGSGYAVSPYRSYGSQMMIDRINARRLKKKLEARHHTKTKTKAKTASKRTSRSSSASGHH